MSDEIFRDLRVHLNTHPVGFPAAENGSDIDVLKRIFTPKQAEVTCRIQWRFSTTEEIFERSTDIVASADELTSILREIVQSGGIYNRITDGRDTWALAPYVVGMYEMNVGNLDDDFKQRHYAYISSPKIDVPVRTKNAVQMRVIPIDESVDAERRVAPYDEIKNLVDQAGDSIGIMECICRKINRLDGGSCDYEIPLLSCTSFGFLAEQFIDQGIAERITRETALANLKKFQETGMVLMPSATEEAMFVCACCKDCCGTLNGLKHSKNPAEQALSNYYATVNQDNCTSCGECERLCPMDAVSTESGTAEVDLKRCIGCGVCVSRCEFDGITLGVKENRASLPKDMDEMYEQFNTERIYSENNS